MKKCKHITCWTDYPFVELGDEPGKPAPIRHVNIVSYDGNKYATVSFEHCGDFLDVKIGYLYSQPGRYGQVKRVNPRKIERMEVARKMKPLWIIVEDGHVFEGHQLHWANCFFSSAIKCEIEAFLRTPFAVNNDVNDPTYKPDGLCKYEIREMTDDELTKYPEALKFCAELLKEYGEI